MDYELLRPHEDAVNKGEGDALIARWESGRYLLTVRGTKKQLPKGELRVIVR